MTITKTQLWIAAGAAAIAFVASLIVLWPSTPPPEAVEEEVVVAEEIEVEPDPRVSEIGSSVEGRKIESYVFGTGETQLLFVGGIHGGYEWNSILLAYEMIDEFSENSGLIPNSLTIHIIPDLNPDGLYDTLAVEGRFTLEDGARDPGDGTGRFNANGVDLNRNFDCKWQPKSSWRGNEVSAGTAPFSEPEAQALRDYVLTHSPDAVVMWHSQANNVYASECEDGVLPVTLEIMNLYADAADYGAVASFDAYPVTGDAEGWMASVGIPAVTVELSSHTSLDYTRNLRAVMALFNYYSQE